MGNDLQTQLRSLQRTNQKNIDCTKSYVLNQTFQTKMPLQCKLFFSSQLFSFYSKERTMLKKLDIEVLMAQNFQLTYAV